MDGNWLSNKSTEKITISIGGMNFVFSLIKMGKLVYCSISAAGTLSSNRNDKNSAIPSEYCPVNNVYLTSKNVTAGNYATNYGTTRYEISTIGNLTIVSNDKSALERSASGCWITN